MINIGNKNGVVNPPYSNVGTPARAEPEAAAGVRGGDRPKHGHQGRLRRVAVPSCTLIPAADTEWYAQTKVPCTPYDPKDAKRLVAALRLSAPDHRSLLISGGGEPRGGPGHPVRGGRGRIQRRHRRRSPATYSALSQRALRRRHDRSGRRPTRTRTATSTPPGHRGRGNFAGYSNPRLDYVLANALRATDPKARAVDYRVAQQIVHADRPIIVLRENMSYAIFDSNLSGIQFSPFGVLLFANAQYK